MENVKNTISYLDGISGNYGYSNQENYGLKTVGEIVEVANLNQGKPNVQVIQLPPTNFGNGATNYSINPAIQKMGDGKSTFQLSVKVAKTLTGSGNTKNPVFFFGSSAYNNTSSPYNAVVANANRSVEVGYVNGKNVIIFKYTDPADDTKFSTYTVSLDTKGEYPFILGALTGNARMDIAAIQMEVANPDHVAQLANGLSTFKLDKFGFASTNDLTTPKDLYQQATNGILIPHAFPCSGSEGAYLDVNEVDGLELKLYVYAR